MKEKILTALKTKYINLGLSEKSFDGVAEFLSKTVTEESQIEEAVKNAELLVKSVQGEADRVRLDSTNKLKELQAEKSKLEEQLKNINPNSTPPANGDGEKGNNDIPTWAKELQEKLNLIEEEKQKLGQLEKQKELKGKAKELMIAKNIDKSLCDDILNDLSISETDTAETLAEKGVNKYNYFKTKFAPETGVPNAPQGGKNTSLDDFFENKKKEQEEAIKVNENVNIK